MTGLKKYGESFNLLIVVPMESLQKEIITKKER